jgi:hypothetical protein
MPSMGSNFDKLLDVHETENHEHAFPLSKMGNQIKIIQSKVFFFFCKIVKSGVKLSFYLKIY